MEIWISLFFFKFWDVLIDDTRKDNPFIMNEKNRNKQHDQHDT